MKTKVLIIIGITILLPLAAAAATNLEVAYPEVGPGGGFGPGGGPAGWVKWIFFFALGVVGITAVGSLIWAGIVWMTSTSEDKTKAAKDRIWGAILGVLLVVGSVLILQTINPDLTRLQNPTLDPSIFQQPEEGPTTDVPGGGYKSYQWTAVPTNQFCEDVLGAGWVDVSIEWCTAPRPTGTTRCCAGNTPDPGTGGGEKQCPSTSTAYDTKTEKCLFVDGYPCYLPFDFTPPGRPEPECLGGYCRATGATNLAGEPVGLCGNKPPGS